MKDKVKRRRIVNSKKIKDLLKDPRFTTQSHRDFEIEKQRKILEQQQFDLDELQTEKLKLQTIKQKSRQLNNEFLKNKRKDYSNWISFYQAYLLVKKQRKEIYDKYYQKYYDKKIAYIEKYELTNYKIKRWFFGMGKEFHRIRWLSRKNILVNLVIVVSISMFLAIVFFIIDTIFGIL